MKTKATKLTSDLNNGEQFKFKNDLTNYEVVDWVYYKIVGQKNKKLLPTNVYVTVWKTI